MVGWYHRLNGHEFEQTPGDDEDGKPGVLQSMGSPPGSTVPGILQARTLEWVAISFSNARK